jgi:hypothetical protein
MEGDNMKIFHHPAVFVSLVLVIVMGGTQAAVAQQQKRFTIQDLPAEVKASFGKAFPHAVMKGAGEEVEKGETMYEIESVDGAMHRDILFKKDGTVYEVEEGMTPSALPKKVAAGIHKSFPHYSIDKAEKTTHGKEISYEVVVKKGKKKYEAAFSLEGKIIEKQQLREQKEKEGEGETNEKDED